MTDRKRIKRIRDFVIDRDGMECCFCQKKLTRSTLTMEHIVPVSKRGTFNTTNLTVSCSKCNNTRGSRPFFEYAALWNFHTDKLQKYKIMYYNNLRIKVLNISKLELDSYESAVPKEIIGKACKVLDIKPKSVSYDDVQVDENFSFDLVTDRKRIIYIFEKIIKLIESQS